MFSETEEKSCSLQSNYRGEPTDVPQSYNVKDLV